MKAVPVTFPKLLLFVVYGLCYTLEAQTVNVPIDYTSIQAAIDAAIDTDTIVVAAGTYDENVDFKGKNIILTSTNPLNESVVAATIIDGTVLFGGTETQYCTLQGFTIKNGTGYFGADCTIGGGIDGFNTHATIQNCVLKENSASIGGGIADCDGLIYNCVITDNDAYVTMTWSGPIGGVGSGLSGCDGAIKNCLIQSNSAEFDSSLDSCNAAIVNCTIVNNSSGLSYCHGSIQNCIIWNNAGSTLYNSSIPAYSCIQGWTEGGTGNISSNPLFANANSDFHLKSEFGRWDSSAASWVYDPNTSPCINAGNPSAAWQQELWPHGGRINMGYYGGTPQASMSGSTVGNIADLDHDNLVNLVDFNMLSQDWLVSEYLLDTDLNHNGTVHIEDLVLFAEQWL